MYYYGASFEEALKCGREGRIYARFDSFVQTLIKDLQEGRKKVDFERVNSVSLDAMKTLYGKDYSKEALRVKLTEEREIAFFHALRYDAPNRESKGGVVLGMEYDHEMVEKKSPVRENLLVYLLSPVNICNVREVIVTPNAEDYEEDLKEVYEGYKPRFKRIRIERDAIGDNEEKRRGIITDIAYWMESKVTDKVVPRSPLKEEDPKSS